MVALPFFPQTQKICHIGTNLLDKCTANLLAGRISLSTLSLKKNFPAPNMCLIDSTIVFEIVLYTSKPAKDKMHFGTRKKGAP